MADIDLVASAMHLDILSEEGPIYLIMPKMIIRYVKYMWEWIYMEGYEPVLL